MDIYGRRRNMLVRTEAPWAFVDHSFNQTLMHVFEVHYPMRKEDSILWDAESNEQGGFSTRAK